MGENPKPARQVGVQRCGKAGMAWQAGRQANSNLRWQAGKAGRQGVPVQVAGGRTAGGKGVRQAGVAGSAGRRGGSGVVVVVQQNLFHLAGGR